MELSLHTRGKKAQECEEGLEIIVPGVCLSVCLKTIMSIASLSCLELPSLFHRCQRISSYGSEEIANLCIMPHMALSGMQSLMCFKALHFIR